MKCNNTSGCAEKINKAADKCGEKINQVCWIQYVGFTGAAANLALCVANSGCLNQNFENANCYEKKCFL